eukprot:scaffold34012_cov46-Prasinocladus_malaysianus.AAC.1
MFRGDARVGCAGSQGVRVSCDQRQPQDGQEVALPGRRAVLRSLFDLQQLPNRRVEHAKPAGLSPLSVPSQPSYAFPRPHGGIAWGGGLNTEARSVCQVIALFMLAARLSCHGHIIGVLCDDIVVQCHLPLSGLVVEAGPCLDRGRLGCCFEGTSGRPGCCGRVMRCAGGSGRGSRTLAEGS